MTTALYQWFFRSGDNSVEVQNDILKRVFFHAMIASVLFWILMKYPVELTYGTLASGNGRIPITIQAVLIPAEFTQRWSILVACTLLSAIVVYPNFCILLHHKLGEKSVRLWSYGVTTCLSLASAYCFLTGFFFELHILEFYALRGDYRF